MVGTAATLAFWSGAANPLVGELSPVEILVGADELFSGCGGAVRDAGTSPTEILPGNVPVEPAKNAPLSFWVGVMDPRVSGFSSPEVPADNPPMKLAADDSFSWSGTK